MRINCCFVYIVLQFILLASKINYQVVLTRELLEQSYGNSLTKLRFLNLSHQQIRPIDPQTFNGLTNLRWLDLNNNQITSIDGETFNELISSPSKSANNSFSIINYV